ncbi:MAG: peroxiredoxin [Gammaproteobacteria bacterium]|nr:peroxiredoxin [Gammaproteobacteria bacterium]
MERVNILRRIAVLSCCSMLAISAALPAEEADVNLGQMAPDFSLPDQTGKKHSLADYRGRWIVLYFYPKDDTPGCTKEACDFRDNFAAIKKLGAEILGVSVDDSQSHAQFSKKYNLPFPLLADADGNVAKQYGALWSLVLVRFAKRQTFIVDPQGKIAKIYRDVKPQTHSGEVIEFLKALKK